MSRPCPPGAFGSLDITFLMFKKVVKAELRINRAQLFVQWHQRQLMATFKKPRKHHLLSGLMFELFRDIFIFA